MSYVGEVGISVGILLLKCAVVLGTCDTEDEARDALSQPGNQLHCSGTSSIDSSAGPSCSFLLPATRGLLPAAAGAGHFGWHRVDIRRGKHLQLAAETCTARPVAGATGVTSIQALGECHASIHSWAMKFAGCTCLQQTMGKLNGQRLRMQLLRSPPVGRELCCTRSADQRRTAGPISAAPGANTP